MLADSKANILLPKPGFPYYEAVCQSCHLEARHFDLLPDKDWEVDLDAVEALADENTVAMVIINPGNPCGNVFTHQHLQKVFIISFSFFSQRSTICFVLSDYEPMD